MDDEPDLLDDLRRADNVEQLQRLLMTRPPSGDGHHHEAVELFTRVHADERDGAVDTAVLLFGCWRWRRVISRLVPEIVSSHVLDEDRLDELASRVFWPDRPSYEHPLSWLGLEVDPASGRVVGVGLHKDQVVSTRLAEPAAQVRRWAAGHLLVRGHASLEQVLNRGNQFNAYAGEAVMAGVLDAYQHLDPDAAGEALEHGLTCGRGSVRRQALSLLAAQDGWPAALTRAQQDPDASVRRWAERHSEPSQTRF